MVSQDQYDPKNKKWASIGQRLYMRIDTLDALCGVDDHLHEILRDLRALGNDQ